MGARADLAAALTEALPDTMQIVDDVRDLGVIDPEYTTVLQLLRLRLEPASTIGAYWTDFALWVVSPEEDPQLVDDDLDDRLDQVIEALQPLTYLGWTAAERDMHPSGFHAYRITIRTRTLNT